ncbi:MAG: methionyl-tRNA formyltransferase [Clostridia bacterium]|nr:methionyl-tRNA formyltransferase [Clostridia bacterium]
MKVIFLGTGDFSSVVLKSIDESRHEVVAIVSQPDKINGRNGKITFSPVKSYALEKNIPLYQFASISKEGKEILSSLNADIMVTSAYGQILSDEIIAICPNGIVNTHASLLPKYRGSSPIQMAILNGDEEIGTTIMKKVRAVDAGDIILHRKIKLLGNENQEECFNMLADLSATAIVEALDLIESGKAESIPQDHEKATFCKKLTKEDGKIDFSKSAKEIHNQVRAFYGFPGAYCFTDYGRLKVIKTELTESEFKGEAGQVIENKKERFVVSCGDGACIAFITVQGEGGKAMSVGSYNLGRPIKVGSILK